MTALFIGLISGTSVDAIDAALVAFDGDAPPSLVHARSHPYPDRLRRDVEHAVRAQTLTLASFAALDARIGDAFADAADALVEAAGIDPPSVSAIGSHGQTLGHFPSGAPAATLQLGDPNRIAARTGTPVVADFRRADVALGGQGAPLAPLFHAAVFAHPNERRAVLNLGGIANLTLLAPDGGVTGFDVGPANTLLDLWAARHGRGERDEGGAFAASGQVLSGLLASLRDDPYFTAPIPKSTGREYFSAEWVERRLGGASDRPADVQATLAELTAVTVGAALAEHAPGTQRVLVCGGGIHNDHLVSRIGTHAGGARVESTAAVGIDPDFVEAMLFAWLARERSHARSPAGLRAVTGARSAAVLGGVWLPPR